MDINEILADQVYTDEFLVSQKNQDQADSDYVSYLGILDNVRDEKNYKWQSDIRIPEFTAHHLAQAAQDVGQYFGTRDFVEVKINDSSDEAKAAAEASKELLNRTLNLRELYHYQKFVRGKGICNLVGRVYLKCWWEQKFENQEVGTRTETTPLDVDVNGYSLTEDWQEPAVSEREVPVFDDVAVVDKFNYDVWDQRNVAVSDEYAYTLQQKEWIIFRSEETLGSLEDAQEMNGYFDLNKLEPPPETTDTKNETYEKDAKKENNSKAEKQYDVFERYGKYWLIEDKDGVRPGLDVNGDILEDATYEEVIITVAKGVGTKTLIGFKRTHFLDSLGSPYKPCIRGLCYIHPDSDDGMGDGQNVRELQTAIDDTFNASQDRVLLATFPSLKGVRQSIEDNSTIYIEPMHLIELEDINDLQEMKFTDNIAGALNQLQYLEDKGRQVEAMNETTTGGVPSIASTTATAVSAAAQSSNVRMNYKSLTFEYTALTELYWMIQQMTAEFASEQTVFELMGDKLNNFDPSLNYYFTPLTQSIETEASKTVKRKEYTQLLQTVISIQHPDTVKVANSIIREITKLMGDEYENVASFNEDIPAQQSGGQQSAAQGEPASNQYGITQTSEEMMARGNE